ncbi:glycosyltransferase family 2 protein [Echinicola sp. CAU 1574]|uniref:Glycosyltransferase family 2 protein n=1 Tax=Echinicola arenosa TaxID=2774144 RepID=A0ABR9ANT4_9BACT|nr:glycosyltransferase [Echinicola arenosa]MBD8490441.1 glycosyltransferase family 2 protein [Echinicola arenosa]
MEGISVVICTHNGASRLPVTLQHICQQKCAYSWELIVVDNCSTDNTTAVCTSFLKEQKINWVIVHESKQGLVHARRCGLENSKYDFILFCDDDNALFDRYLQHSFEVMAKNPQIGILGGFGSAVIEGEKPEWFDQYSHSYAVGKQAMSNGKISSSKAEVYGAGAIVRKEPIKKLFRKGFETAMQGRSGKKLGAGDDVEWCYIFQLLGYEIWFDDRLRFDHYIPASRLTWEYYLNLKAGIASGAGLLYPYGLFLDTKIANTPSFWKAYLGRMVKSFLVWVKSSLIVLLPFKISSERQLAHRIISAQCKAYLVDAFRTKRHYDQLKSILL